ncbi:MAG: 50S ribosomal protein L21 [FCB group bacterium]|jgi:large subunit ribosomal protein L21|nr:50S ribosomal protein L21 [FCB group bacterium]
MYAVVKTGGKQIQVAAGDLVRIEKLDAAPGDQVELTEVCLLATDDGVVVNPADLGGAKVVCQVVAQGRAKKIRVFKKKRRKNYIRTKGHRQSYTEIRVRDIVA